MQKICTLGAINVKKQHITRNCGTLLKCCPWS